jgi:hypothetical protein
MVRRVVRNFWPAVVSACRPSSRRRGSHRSTTTIMVPCIATSMRSPGVRLQAGRFPLEDLIPLPAYLTPCGEGFGLAVCPTLDLLVTSDERKNNLSVWGLPGGTSGGGTSGRAGVSVGAGVGGALAGGGGGGLTLLCTLGGDGSAAPLRFKFKDGIRTGSGYLVFITITTTGDGSSDARPLLVVTDAGHDAVHLVDVVGGTHAGYLASPGSIAGPRGVAASGTSPLVAVSAWKREHSGDHVVLVYQGTGGGAWETVRVIGGGFGAPGSRDGQLYRPRGLRFSGDGSGICVADFHNDRASVFRVDDGGFVRHVATGLAMDVEEVEGGWLVASFRSLSVEFVGDGDGGDGGDRPLLGGCGVGSGELSYPVAIAVVPGLGLVVRDACVGGRLQVFATPDAMAMAAMSPARVSWMCAVARAVVRRRAGSVSHACAREEDPRGS